MSKSSLLLIFRDHFKTLRDVRTNKLSKADFAEQVGLPVVLGALCWKLDLTADSFDSLITGVSIVSGLLCGMAVFLFEFRTGCTSEKKIERRVLVIVDECMSNTMWSITCGFAIVGFAIIGELLMLLEIEGLGSLITGLAVSASVHFVLVLAMCLKRLYSAYKSAAVMK